MTQITENVAEVRGRIAAAAARAGRGIEGVRLVAVTKYVGLDEIRALVAAGCTDLGESRPQQLWDRVSELGDLPVRWHMIGHIQRNKVERTTPLVAMIHSLDSLRLAEAIDAAASKLDRTVPALLEVNISREPAKQGFAPEEIEPLLPKLIEQAHIEIRGLMCMAGLEGGADEARRDFADLRTLRDRLQASCPATVRLDELSMGMSGDYEIAIEEGATIVRIGSALFEKPEVPAD
ncbi:MAG: YggS family pyridoxal phosphate-dependent enzyme [Thermoguttaceae bacterium]